MRTTLDIDDDVLRAVKVLARREKKTVGRMISELASKGLATQSPGKPARAPKSFFGFKPLPRVLGIIVTNAAIDQLREDAD